VIQLLLAAIASPVTGLDQHSATPLGATAVVAASLAILARIVAPRERPDTMLSAAVAAGI